MTTQQQPREIRIIDGVPIARRTLEQYPEQQIRECIAVLLHWYPVHAISGTLLRHCLRNMQEQQPFEKAKEAHEQIDRLLERLDEQEAREEERRQRQEASRSRRAWIDAISVSLLSLFGVPNAA